MLLKLLLVVSATNLVLTVWLLLESRRRGTLTVQVVEPEPKPDAPAKPQPSIPANLFKE